MFNFIKKILGLPTEEEKLAAQAPYKIEPPKMETVEELPKKEVKQRKPRAKPSAKPVEENKKAVAKKPATASTRKPRTKKVS